MIRNVWGPPGDRPDCEATCEKCGYKRLRSLSETSPNWCRRCRYENFDEYFGPGGVNEKYMPEEEREARYE